MCSLDVYKRFYLPYLFPLNQLHNKKYAHCVITSDFSQILSILYKTSEIKALNTNKTSRISHR